MQESDLYQPLKVFLERQGYEVKGEVLNCDVVALRQSEPPVLIELKLTLNLTVLLQITDHFAISDRLYIGIPGSCAVLKNKKKRVIRLLRLLNVGLLTINFVGSNRYVEVLLDPGNYHPRPNRKRKERLLGEFAQRAGDPNSGGVTRQQGLMTAYRQRALAIAVHLQSHGPAKASAVAKQTGDLKARDILYRNVYGWFDSHGRGIYALSRKGMEELPAWITIQH